MTFSERLYIICTWCQSIYMCSLVLLSASMSRFYFLVDQVIAYCRVLLVCVLELLFIFSATGITSRANVAKERGK